MFSFTYFVTWRLKGVKNHRGTEGTENIRRRRESQSVGGDEAETGRWRDGIEAVFSGS
jgi:hypothetical protein